MHKAFYKQSITQNYRFVSSYRFCLLDISITLFGTANTGCVFYFRKVNVFPGKVNKK